MTYFPIEILPADLSYRIPYDGGPAIPLADNEPVQYLNANVDAAIYPAQLSGYTYTSASSTTIGPFTTSTHRAGTNLSKMSVVRFSPNDLNLIVSAGPKDRYVHVFLSGTISVSSVDASNYICWGIRQSIVDSHGNIIPLRRDDDIFKVVSAVNASGLIPISGYEVFPISPNNSYYFSLVAGYYGSVLSTGSFGFNATTDHPFTFSGWVGG